MNSTTKFKDVIFTFAFVFYLKIVAVRTFNVEQLETKINAVASIQSNNVEIVLTGSDADKVDVGMKVYIGKVETTIDNVKYDDLGRTIAICSADLSDGNYKAEIVTESIHPISFLFR